VEVGIETKILISYYFLIFFLKISYLQAEYQSNLPSLSENENKK